MGGQRGGMAHHHPKSARREAARVWGSSGAVYLRGPLRIGRELLHIPSRVAKICTIDRAQHVSLGFIGNRVENGGLDLIRFGEPNVALIRPSVQY